MDFTYDYITRAGSYNTVYFLYKDYNSHMRIYKMAQAKYILTYSAIMNIQYNVI